MTICNECPDSETCNEKRACYYLTQENVRWFNLSEANSEAKNVITELYRDNVLTAYQFNLIMCALNDKQRA